jgi:heptosyltransferase-4
MKIRLGPLHAKRRAMFGKLALWLLKRAPVPAFKPESIKKVIFLRDNDKFGDLIVSTIAIRELKLAGKQVDVIAGLRNAELLKLNPHVDQLHVHNDKLFSVIKLALKLRKEKYDLLIDLRNEVPTYKDIVLMSWSKVRHVIGFNRGMYPVFDVNLKEDFSLNQHAAWRNFALLEALQISCSGCSRHYDVHIDQREENKVKDYLSQLPKARTLLINLKGEGPYRRLNQGQLDAILDYMQSNYSDWNVVLTAKPEDLDSINTAGMHKSPFKTYFAAVALVKHADAVISPDTSIVHAAAAFDKPLLGLYEKDRTTTYLNSRAWGPNNPNAIVVQSEEFSVYSIPLPSLIKGLDQVMQRCFPSNSQQKLSSGIAGIKN